MALQKKLAFRAGCFCKNPTSLLTTFYDHGEISDGTEPSNILSFFEKKLSLSVFVLKYRTISGLSQQISFGAHLF